MVKEVKTMNESETITITVRKIDKKLYAKARANAIEEGVPIGAWINQAITYYLTLQSNKPKHKR